MMSFCYHIIASFANEFDLYEILVFGKVIVCDEYFDTMSCFRPCLVFDVLLISFCSITLILPNHHLFELLKIMFTKYLLWLFKIISRTFKSNIFFIQSPVFIYNVICDFIFLYFLCFTISLAFKEWNLIFTVLLF